MALLDVSFAPSSSQDVAYTNDDARWFADEIGPLEPVLRAYLLARFPLLPGCDDVLRETYARLQRARLLGTLKNPRARLFAEACRCAKAQLFSVPTWIDAAGQSARQA